MKKHLDRLNSSRITLILFLLAVFAIMLYLNCHTPMTCDDFFYAHSFKTYKRIRSISDIVVSMQAHYGSTNGRIAAHFLVSLFLMLPKMVFNVINAGMFTALLYLIYSYRNFFKATGGRTEENVVLLILIFCAIWLLNPSFGQVYFWLDGAVNYLWGEVFALIWMLPQLKYYLDREKKMPVWGCAVYCVYSLFMGSYSENTTPALVFMALLFMAMELLIRREKPEAWRIYTLIPMVIGFLFMVTAPGEIKSKAHFPQLYDMVLTIWQLMKDWLHFWPVQLSFVLMYIVSFRTKGEAGREKRLLALIWMLGSLAANYILFFSSGAPWRSFAIALILMLPGCVILADEVFDTAVRTAAYAVCAVAVCLTLYWGWRAVEDINEVYYKFNYNEALISEQLAAGEKELHVPFIYPKTKYSSFYGLFYIHPYSGNWLNVGVARYYGAEAIIGYDLYEPVNGE